MKRSWVLGFLMVLSVVGFSQNSRITSLSTQAAHNDSGYVMVDKVGYTRAKKEMIKDVVAISSRVDDTTTEVVNGKIKSKIFRATGNNVSSRNSGNVGIGISNPTDKLHVFGNVKGDTLKGILLGSWTGSANYLAKIRFTNDSIVKNDSIAKHRIALNKLLDSLGYIYTEAQVNALLLTKLSVSRFTADSAKKRDSIADRYTKTQTNNLLGVKIDSNIWWRGTGDHSIKQNSDVLGINNVASGDFSFVTGANNTASGLYSSVTGGESNSASNGWSVISGGVSNSITKEYSGIVGGESNSITQVRSFIGGGANHLITGAYSGILGGNNNDITNSYSGIIGGSDVTLSGDHSFVGGGYVSTISGIHSGVVGGSNVSMSGDYSFIGGGHISTDSSEYSGIIGGSNNKLTSAADRSVILGGQNISCSIPDYVYVPNLYSVGKIGIGYTNPSSSLAVNGNVGIGYTNATNGLAVNGNIGIGITNPIYPLQSIQGTSSLVINSSNFLGFGNATLNPVNRFQIEFDKDAVIDSNLSITTTGRIGISTTNPLAKIHIANPTGVSGSMIIGYKENGFPSFTQGVSGLKLYSYTTTTTNKYTPFLEFGSFDGTFTTVNPRTLAWIGARATQTYSADTTTGTALDFATTQNNAGATATPTVRMTIDQSGNVGIGTTSPSYRLSVKGGYAMSDSLIIPNAKPKAPVAGAMRWSNDTLFYYNGSAWKWAKFN